MMYIGKAKLDNRGRITLPKSFIDANGVKPESDVYFTSIQASDNSIKLMFAGYRSYNYKTRKGENNGNAD